MSNNTFALFNIEIDNCDDALMKKITNIINDFKTTFDHQDFTTMSEDEKLNGLYERYLYYQKYFAECTSVKDASLHNVIVQLIQKVRKHAVLLDLDVSLSKKITISDASPFNKFLRDHNFHKFQYEDIMQTAMDLATKTDLLKYQNEFIVQPKVWIGSEYVRKLIEKILPSSNQELHEYVSFMKSNFSDQYCKDFEQFIQKK